MIFSLGVTLSLELMVVALVWVFLLLVADSMDLLGVVLDMVVLLVDTVDMMEGTAEVDTVVQEVTYEVVEDSEVARDIEEVVEADL